MQLYIVVPNIRRIYFNFALLILFSLFTVEFTSNLIKFFLKIITFDAAIIWLYHAILRVRILGNYEMSGKSQNLLEAESSAQSPFQKQDFIFA